MRSGDLQEGFDSLRGQPGQEELDIRSRVIFCPYDDIVRTVETVVDNLDAFRKSCYGGWDPDEWAADRLCAFEGVMEKMDAWAECGRRGVNG